MLKRTFKLVKVRGRADFVLREQYLREDVHCNSPICQLCSPDTAITFNLQSVGNIGSIGSIFLAGYIFYGLSLQSLASKTMRLDADANHYVIPCLDIIEKYLEILQSSEIKGIIIIQSLLSKVSQTFGYRFANKLVNICKDIRRGSAVFLNEVCVKTHVQRVREESSETWLVKCFINVAEYYAEHLSGTVPIVLLTEDVEIYKSQLKNESIQVICMKQYLETMWKGVESLLQLYDSLNLAIAAGSVKDLSKSYDNYVTNQVLEAGIKAGRFFRGYLNVNKHNASQEAFVSSSKVFAKGSGDIYICGMIDRNRAIHGDEVVVEVYPEHQWKSRCLHLVDNPEEKENVTENNAALSKTIPTGKVVGILERCWRDYVATLPEEDEDSSASSRKERLIVVPYDYRIPKIRIVTRQAEKIRNKRIIVRIDSWEKESQYPNGHLVQVLGEVGDMETEIQSLLFEHNMVMRDFPPKLMKELPSCSDDNPWVLEEKEILKRRDLRSSHLIFSIDPKGCEDVDDALSVRGLPNGNLELGVHIADVTYFVKSLSAVDIEAKNRSTSVYLPDRRYDMLPHILSGNLCSLLGNVDRYAVSVIWELNADCKVKDVWYGRTIINSSYKLCYEVAQDILSNAPAEEIIPEIPEFQGLPEEELNSRFAALKDSLSKLYHIASILRRDRLNAGGLELSSLNMKFEIDKMLPSIVSDISCAKELPIHKTVAECMIFANHWVGKKISAAFPHQAVLRRHPNPREADLAELQKLALSKGFLLNIQSNKDLAFSLERAVDKNDPTVNQVLRIIATQAMNQATYFCTGCYNIDDFHHYGLGLEKYTHFTSPIRRYADVMVHRLLLASVNEANIDTNLETAEIEKLCLHMNDKHKAAQDLEKDAKQLFLSSYVEELSSKNNSSHCFVDGIIYSLLANGMLVFVPKYGIKGAVQLCNKDKKVAVVKDDVQWLDGHLDIVDSSLIVKANGIEQKYSIFDHVTLHVKILKSRCHQHKIVYDLVKNVPYVSDLADVASEEMDALTLEADKGCINKDTKDVKDMKSAKNVNDIVAEPKGKPFNMYLFLLEMKQLCLADKK